MAKSILFTFRHPPYGTALAREGLDALLAAAVFEQDIAVLFINDGVLQLLDQQAPSAGQKNHQRMLSALSLYGVDKLYADGQSLTERALDKQHLSLDVQLLQRQAVQKLFHSYDHILSF